MKKFALFLFFLFFSTVVFSQFKNGKCIRVVDGDTYIFVTTSKDTLKIRDAYMNTPESKNSACSEQQPYSTESTEKAKEYLLDKDFKIRILGTDVYGRKIAYAVLNDNILYHKVMIREGYAWSFRQSGANYRLQKEAKANSLGLWQYENPINPSIWLKTYSTHKIK